MKLATRLDGSRDGALVVVSADGARWLSAAQVAPTMQEAIDDWGRVEPALGALAAEADARQGQPVDVANLMAPLPRAWQWLDGSAYPQHGALMQLAFGHAPIETNLPLMYQGLSDRFLGALDDIPLPSEADGIDFEGEFGVVTDAVPMGVTAEAALGHIKLLVQINDWSLRAIAPIEMKTGFGWVQAKPACSVAPFAVTPDALGEHWRNGRIAATLDIRLNGERFGVVESGEEMAFGFHELIAHAARTRSLPAGTIVGSGTVSSANYAAVGSSCLSERRAIDVIAGRPPTPFMCFGDRVRMEALVAGEPLFGVIDQQVVRANV